MSHSFAMQQTLNTGYYTAHSRGDTAFLPSLETCNDDREAARLEARREAKYVSEFPTAVDLNGSQIPIVRYDQINSMNSKVIKQAALNLRDAIDASGSRFFEHYTHLRLNTHAQHEALVKWFIAVQLIICNRLGYNFSPLSFGCPKDENFINAMAPQHQEASAPLRSAPCWSQEDLSERVEHMKRSQQPLQRRSANEADLYQAREARDYDASIIGHYSKKTQFTLG